MSSRKKILVFIDWFAPGFRAGGPVQSMVNMIAHLHPEFEFFVVTRDTDYCENKPYAGIRPDSWNVLPDGTSVYYFSESGLTKNKLAELIASQPFDFFYINGIYSRWFSITPLRLLRRQKKEGRVLVAVRGMLAETAIAIKAGKKKVFLAAAKLTGLFGGVIFHATSEQEVHDIRRVFGSGADIRLAGNLPRKTLPGTGLPEKKPGEVRIVCIARIAPEKNILFAIEILQKVKADIVADFYGPEYDAGYADQCRKAAALLPGNVKLNFREAVPSESVFKTLGKYHLLLLPTQGENFGHIILEAMDCGLPVLVSDRTPWKMLENAGGKDIPLDKPADWIKSIDEFAALGPAGFTALSEKARVYAGKYRDDNSVVEACRSLFR